jgi:hypothetical protein
MKGAFKATRKCQAIGGGPGQCASRMTFSDRRSAMATTVTIARERGLSSRPIGLAHTITVLGLAANVSKGVATSSPD